MKTFALISLLAMASLIAADDPAAHTVIVPYDPSGPLLNQKADRYYLPYDSFQRLWAAAKRNRLPKPEDADATQKAAILSATYRGRIEEKALVLEGRLEVMTRGEWTPLTLSLASGEGSGKREAAVYDVRVDGRPVATEGKLVRIQKAGAHVVELMVNLPPLPVDQPYALSFPDALAGTLFLKAPLQDGPLIYNKGTYPAEEHGTEGRVFVVPLVDHDWGFAPNEVTIRRTSRGLPRGEGPVPSATVSTTLTLRELLPDEVESSLEFSFQGAARRTFSFTVDADVSVTSLNAALPVTPAERVDIGQRWQSQPEGGRLKITVTLTEEISHRAVIDFTGQRLRGHAESPLIQAAAARSQQQITVLHEDGMDVKLQPAAGQTRQPDQTPPADDLRAAGVFRLASEARLAYQVAAVADLDEAAIDYVFQVSEQKSELLAAVSLKRKRGAWQSARIRTPAGYEVQSITGPALKQWQHANDELYLHFDPALAGSDARVIVHLARTVDQPVPFWKIVPLQPVGFEKQTGRALVAAHAAMQVRLPGIGGRRDIQELDPTALDTTFAIAPPFEKKRGLRLEGIAWTFEVALARQPARFSVDAVALVLVSDSGIRISQQVAAIVDQGALRQVTVRLPATLPEAAVSGPLLREMRSRVEGAERIYECSFQTDVLDRTELTFDHDLPIAPTLAVPLVKVADAQRLQRFFVLDNASAREARATDTAALEAVSRDVIPYLPEGLGRPQFFRATSDDSRLTISYTELTGTEANAALVTLADITTVLRVDGERWDTVVYSLVNRSLQFLPVILPKGADLISASVSGETVRADQETRSGRSVHLIPLIHTKPGQRALEVRLVWRFAPADWRNARLDDPELAGLSAERTGWTVWTPPGYQLKDFDGNMEEVGAEDHDFQKIEGMLSELGDVNRELASGKLDYSEAKDAYSSANRLAEEIRAAKDEVLGKAMRFKTRVSSSIDELQFKKADDLDKGVAQQKEVLEEKWKEYEGKDKNGRSTGKPEGKKGLKTDWNYNKSGTGTLELQSKANTFTGATVMANGAQVVNDNVAVNNTFFGGQIAQKPQNDGLMATESAGAIPSTIQNGMNSLNTNARGNSLSQTPAVPNQSQTLGNLADAQMEETRRQSALAVPARPAAPGALGPAAGANPFGDAPSTISRAPVVAAPSPADPFASPARVSGGMMMENSAASVAAGASSADDSRVAVILAETQGGQTAQTLESLRPTGRRSLSVEVPLEGEVRHFSKLKDHAVLELKITRPWDPDRTRSAWILGAGVLILAGWSRVSSRRRA